MMLNLPKSFLALLLFIKDLEVCVCVCMCACVHVRACQCQCVWHTHGDRNRCWVKTAKASSSYLPALLPVTFQVKWNSFCCCLLKLQLLSHMWHTNDILTWYQLQLTIAHLLLIKFQQTRWHDAVGVDVSKCYVCHVVGDYSPTGH